MEIRRQLEGRANRRLFQASFRLRTGDGQGPRAYLDRQPYFQQMGRFLVHETAIHFIDVFRFLLGEPEAVLARLVRLNPAIAGEDAGVIFEFAGNRRRCCSTATGWSTIRRKTVGSLWASSWSKVTRA
ncbi:MAG: hypothetical protein R3C69_16410 [Geminicoccaceae bacterium]